MKKLTTMALLLLTVLLLSGNALDSHASNKGCSKECRCICECKLVSSIGGGLYEFAEEIWRTTLHVDGYKSCNLYYFFCGKCKADSAGWNKAKSLCKSRNMQKCQNKCKKKAEDYGKGLKIDPAFGIATMKHNCD